MCVFLFGVSHGSNMGWDLSRLMASVARRSRYCCRVHVVMTCFFSKWFSIVIWLLNLKSSRYKYFKGKYCVIRCFYSSIVLKDLYICTHVFIALFIACTLSFVFNLNYQCKCPSSKAVTACETQIDCFISSQGNPLLCVFTGLSVIVICVCPMGRWLSNWHFLTGNCVFFYII